MEPETLDEATARAQLVELHKRILQENVQPNSIEVDISMTMLSEAYFASGNTTDAWKSTLAAMLQAPEVLFY